MALIYRDIDKMLKPLKSCSFMHTGMRPILQKVFFCHDCNPSMNETYCETCIETCHFDHHITKAKELKTFCHCGLKLHRIEEAKLMSNVKGCSFWEFDEFSKNLTNAKKSLKCSECRKRMCSYCIFFCHYHHIDKMTPIKTNDLRGCECQGNCHNDDRILFYYMKDFSMFRLENLYTTHMINLLMEAPTTSTKILSLLKRKMKEIKSDFLNKRFRWNKSLSNSASAFSRSIMCLYFTVRNVNINYFSTFKDNIIIPKVVIQLCIDNSDDDKYDVKLIKKNLLFLLFKFHLSQDFDKFNKFKTKDYANVTCIQRLHLYNAVRNDEFLKNKYFGQDQNFRIDIIRLLEKFAIYCKADDHLSMAILATMLTIVKLLIQYGVFNYIHLRMIADIIELLMKNFKFDKIAKSNEEYKEMIFKKLPSIIYIMIFCYNDYIFLENIMYKFVKLTEFSIGKSYFGTKLMSSVFVANIRYLMKYFTSRKYAKIMKITLKTLNLLTSENDTFQSTIFNIEKQELLDFVMYYDSLTDLNYNNNFPFVIHNEDVFLSQFYHKKFPYLQMRITNFSKNLQILLDDKNEMELAYLEYFTFKKKNIQEVIQIVDSKIRKFFSIVNNCKENINRNYNSRGAIGEIINILEDPNKPEDILLNDTSLPFNEWFVTDGQLLLNKSHFHYSIIKLLKICHIQSNCIEEYLFENIIKFLEFYILDSVSNTQNILCSCYLKILCLYMNRFPHLILNFIHKILKNFKNKKVILNDYSYIYDCLKDTFNSKYTKLEDAEKYLTAFIYHIKCLKILKDFIPEKLVLDMKERIREFLQRLIKNDKGVKEYFWVNYYKKRLLMKDSEFNNYLNFDEYVNDIEKENKNNKLENEKVFGQSAEAKRKRMIREAKRRAREEKKLSKVNESGDYSVGNESLNVSLDVSLNTDIDNFNSNLNQNVLDHLNHESLLDEPSFATDLTIVEDEIVEVDKRKINNNQNNNQINEYLNIGEHFEQSIEIIEEKKEEENFMLENIYMIETKIEDVNLPLIDENNFDNSGFKFEADPHQELSVSNEALENLEDQILKGNILSPLMKEETVLNNSILGTSDIFSDPMLNNLNNESVNNELLNEEENNEIANEANYTSMINLDYTEDEGYINNIRISEQEDLLQEKAIFSDLDNISPELFENKILRTKNLNKNKRQLFKLKKLKLTEKKEQLIEKILNSNYTAKAFVKFLEMINLFIEDLTSREMQVLLRKFFPRLEINNVLNHKRYLKDIKLRSEILKMLRINYLNVPIRKDISYFDLFYLEDYEFFTKLYEKNSIIPSKSKLSDLEKISQILIYELANFTDIIYPFCGNNLDKITIQKNKKSVKYYISEGILSTVKLYVDKVYSHGQNITGQELCNAFKIIYHFLENKNLIDNLLKGAELKYAISLSKKKSDEAETDLDDLFKEYKGGVNNFNRNSIFQVLYKNLHKSLELVNPQFKKSISDVWLNINKKFYKVGINDGIDSLPNLIDKFKILPLGIVITDEIKILNEYGTVCRFYIQQSKNFSQSALVSCFNCLINDSNINYRELFIKFFSLTYSNDIIREHPDYNLLEIMNKSLEVDYERLHPILLKNFREEESNKNEKLFNELNNQLLYNMIILFVYVNRYDSHETWNLANYHSCLIVKFFQYLVKNPTTQLHEFILKHSHRENSNLNYNFFILLEAIMTKIIKLSKWGRDSDLKNEIFFDNMFVIFHTIVNCLSDYARESDEEGVILIYLRIKRMIYGLKKMMYYETENVKDIIFEVKLSIIHILNSLLDEGKSWKIYQEISYNFEPFRMFKLCVSIFKLQIHQLMKRGNLYDLSVDKEDDYNNISLKINNNLKELLLIYQQDEDFYQNPLLILSIRIFSYIRTLKDTYRDSNAIKCFYAIKRFKNSAKNKFSNSKQKTLRECKFLHDTGTHLDIFLEMDEITETEFVVYKFLKNIIGVIEVYSYRNKLEYVYFNRIPLTYYLGTESLDKFLDNFYDREFSSQKIEGLNNFIHLTLEQCYFNYHLESQNSFLGSLNNNFFNYKIVSMIISIISCSMHWSYTDYKIEPLKILAFSWDNLNLFYLFCLLLIWSTVKFYPRLRHKKLNYLKINKIDDESKLELKSLVKIIFMEVCMSDSDFLFIFIHFVICLFSVIYNLNTLRFFQLVSLIFISDTLFRIIQFVGKNWKELFLLIVVCFILISCGAAITFDFYGEFALNGSDKVCKSTSQCIFYFIFYGLRLDSGVSSLMDSDFDSESYNGGRLMKRLFLENGFHLFAKGIVMSLLVSIFIFAYFDYKKSVELRNWDSTNRCFVCHLDRDVFIKYKIDFTKHIKNEHKVVNYLFFIMYVLTKNPQNLTKIEKYVLDKFRISNYDWIPSKDTLSLQNQLKKIKENKIKITNEYS